MVGRQIHHRAERVRLSTHPGASLVGPNLPVGVLTVRRHLFRISSSIDAAWLTKRREYKDRISRCGAQW
jgi:hypothetical protein